MPVYEYKCSKCEKIEDRLVSFSSVDDQICACSDSAPMQKIDTVNSINFALKGGGWYKSSYR